jgi:hypothetical protein
VLYLEEKPRHCDGLAANHLSYGTAHNTLLLTYSHLLCACIQTHTRISVITHIAVRIALVMLIFVRLQLT